MKKVFPILALCVFSSTLGIGIVSPLLPLYVKNLGATRVWLGIIVAAYFASNSIATPIAGRLSDRRGRKIFLVVGPCCLLPHFDRLCLGTARGTASPGTFRAGDGWSSDNSYCHGLYR
jgi:MFS family permease